MKNLRSQIPGQSRTEYLLRVAAEHISKYAYEDVTFYDNADCDGACLAEELRQEADDMRDGFKKEK